MTPDQKAVLVQLLEDPEIQALGQDYQAIAAHLNDRPMIPNPTPQGQVQALYSVAEIFGLLGSDVVKILEVGSNVYIDWVANQLKLPGYSARTDLLKVLGHLASGAISGQKTLLEVLGAVINSQDKALLISKAAVLKASDLISAEVEASILAYANKKIPDPSWSPEIPGNSIAATHGLPLVTEAQIQEVDNV